MSDTPRSDIISHNTMDIPFYEWVYLAACQELERELTAALARADALQVVNVEQQQWIIAAERELSAETARAEKAEAELAEARRQVDALIEQCSNGCPPDKDYKGPCEIGTTCEDHWRDWSANEARKGTT